MRRFIFFASLIGIFLPYLGVSYRFGSFAPIRDNESEAKWFVDGEDYMTAVADYMQSAKSEILITDWQMNPHIFLKRPEAGISNLEWRLDKLLLKKANTVKIYILLYYDTKIINTGSKYVEQFLNHDNITVIRHPDSLATLNHPMSLGWSHHEKIIVIDRSIAFVGGIDLAFGRWDTYKHSLADDYHRHPCIEEETYCKKSFNEEYNVYQRWIGKDYGNTFIGGGIKDFDKPLLDYIDRKIHPRLPWHDVSCAFTGPAVMDVVNHFIQRYQFINNNSIRQLHHKNPMLSMNTWHNNKTGSLFNSSDSNVSIQVLRSVSEWSGGLPREESIHKAYLHAIENSEHMIYIENQFFISSLENTQREVLNGIQKALCDRIVRAFKEKQDFHVFIILPLQPEIAGEWGESWKKDTMAYWNYATIYHGKDSLLDRLSKQMPETKIKEYLSVYGLRTHGTLNNSVITEIIYVHSKLMIVDDRLTIIGSANINDRSMLGDRDSELNVVIEDRELIDGKMKGKDYRVGRFSHGLRYHLFREHLGLLGGNEAAVPLDPEDPLKKSFYLKLNEIAKRNAETYIDVFRPKIIPNDNVHNLDELKKWNGYKGIADKDQGKARDKLKAVQGRIVTFPSQFLKDYLKPAVKGNIWFVTKTDHDDL